MLFEMNYRLFAVVVLWHLSHNFDWFHATAKAAEAGDLSSRKFSKQGGGIVRKEQSWLTYRRTTTMQKVSTTDEWPEIVAVRVEHPTDFRFKWAPATK
jgi:hypothetical protein